MNKPSNFGNFCSLAAALAIIPALAHAEFTPTYTVTDLGLLPGSQGANSVDLNNQGDAVGLAFEPNAMSPTNQRGVVFHRGRIIDVAPSAVASDTNDINAKGDVVGEFYDGHKWRGFTYINGAFKGFEPLINATDTTAQAVNDIGQVAGFFTTTTNANDHVYIRQPNGTFSDLGDFGLIPFIPAINNQGRVLIGTDTGTHQDTYISRPGSTSLEKVPSLINKGSVVPGDMNRYGVVVGSAQASQFFYHAYIYFEGRIKDLGLLRGSDQTTGYGINSFLQTVGSAHLVVGVEHGWINMDGKMRDINELLSSKTVGWVISLARSINDHGEVLADANFKGNATHAVLLTPNAIMPSIVP